MGLGGAAAVHAIVIAVYLFTPKEIYEPFIPPITIGKNIPVERDPDPLPPPEKLREEPRTEVFTPKSEMPTPIDHSRIGTVPEQGVKLTDLTPFEGSADATILPMPEPVIVNARPDPRYMQDFQPDYPTNLQRLDLEGSVTVRVKIGADGKVKAVQMVSASHEDFFKATERQALRRWRFKPATRDGEPVESWREMTVHFRMES